MGNYWDSFDCEIQCEEVYGDYENWDEDSFEYVEDDIPEWPF